MPVPTAEKYVWSIVAGREDVQHTQRGAYRRCKSYGDTSIGAAVWSIWKTSCSSRTLRAGSLCPRSSNEPRPGTTPAAGTPRRLSQSRGLRTTVHSRRGCGRIVQEANCPGNRGRVKGALDAKGINIRASSWGSSWQWDGRIFHGSVEYPVHACFEAADELNHRRCHVVVVTPRDLD